MKRRKMNKKKYEMYRLRRKGVPLGSGMGLNPVLKERKRLV